MTHESLIEVTNPADGPVTRLFFLILNFEESLNY